MRVATSLVVLASLGVLVFRGYPNSRSEGTGSWHPAKAAEYLDQRIQWWMEWPSASRDHQTFCISCHTVLPYALARPALRPLLHEESVSANERAVLDNVIKRVRLWKEIEPYYADRKYGAHKGDQSRGTEAVLNALILASYDSPSGRLGADTNLALDHMWALQQSTQDVNGAWKWIYFNNLPFEGHDSQYYGACLAALAAGAAGPAYRSRPEIREHLESLRQYLNREFPKQSPINDVVLLWASVRWPGLLTSDRQSSIVRRVLSMQESDGGWNLADLAWTWRDWTVSSLQKMFTRSYGTPLKDASDGYATGVVTLALEQAGIRGDNAQMKKAVAWLVRNQDKSAGYWQSYSLNNRRDPSSATGRFMSDAATAYAVLALTQGDVAR